ncbi:MAG: FAD-dependent thymidylate synthase [Actinobacteria bacterium]|nr:FAD-dependent thymidylate synthase [Actinomycetota bacterium]
MRLRVLNEETNEFTTGRICDVVDKGEQPVYALQLEDGKEVKATENHRLLTDEGWMTLREAVGLIGSGTEARMTRPCRLLTNGTKAYMDRSWLEARRKEGLSVQEMADQAGCSYHTIRKWLARHDLRFSPQERNFRPGNRPWSDGRKGYKVQRTWTPEWKEAIRTARSGPNSNFWRGGISSDRANVARWTTDQAPAVHYQYDYTCQSCGRRGGLLHAHHIIPVWADASLARDIGNLVSVCDACHRLIHRTRASEVEFAQRFEAFLGRAEELGDLPSRKGYRLTAHPVGVASIEYVGVQQTYDLCVEGPWHNFVANGIVVHNSFNEESARYHKLADDFYVPDAAAVRGQVGKPGAYTFETVDGELAEETRERLKRIYAGLYAEYNTMMEQGVAKELARAVLPFGIYTQFYWTLNARSLMNFLSLRNSEFAQYEIRVYAEAVERFFAEKMPVTHACFIEFGRRSP